MSIKCPQCGKSFDAEAEECPWCGERRQSPGSCILKSSTILISTGSSGGVYRSMEEVPRPLRNRLLKSTSGVNAGTILIADRRGRQEIARAIRRLPGLAQRGGLQAVLEGTTPEVSERRRTYLRRGAALILLILVAVLGWLVLAPK